MMASNRDRTRSERTAELIKEQQRKERRRQLMIGGVIAAVLAAIVGVGFLVQSMRDTTGKTASDVPAGLSASGFGVTVGDTAAPVEMIVYEDFQCPACQQFEAGTRDQLAQAIDAGKIQVEYRPIAFLDRASTTDYSSRALNASMAVLDTAGVDVWDTFHNLLFDNQPAEGTAGLTDDQLIDLAVQAGAEKSKIESMVKDNVFKQWVVNATDQMSKNGVNGTPTIFIDGTKYGDNGPQEAIDATLKAIG
jgi:protein-disulfide isomerase